MAAVTCGHERSSHTRIPQRGRCIPKVNRRSPAVDQGIAAKFTRDVACHIEPV
jgi:hypothetical protein